MEYEGWTGCDSNCSPNSLNPRAWYEAKHPDAAHLYNCTVWNYTL